MERRNKVYKSWSCMIRTLINFYLKFFNVSFDDDWTFYTFLGGLKYENEGSEIRPGGCTCELFTDEFIL